MVAALEDDASRESAEAAVIKMGRAARTDLIMSARQRRPSPECESKLAIVLFVEFDMTITNAAEAWARERIHAGLQAVVLTIFDPGCPKFHIAVS